MPRSNWFEVDKEGLAKLQERRGGKSFVLFELIQNAWDQNVSRVSVTLTPIEGKPYAHLIVEDDDPDGFHDLTHAFTLFADSSKKADAAKRGRFNLGEKLVLACCQWATISTTTGTVRFEQDGSRNRTSQRTGQGSRFEAQLRMTRAEFQEACTSVRLLIPPAEIETTFNGVPLVTRHPVAQFETVLPTEISDAEGNLRRTSRKAAVMVYAPLAGEIAGIYEMGIPVVETGDKYHVDVQQKVPVNLDRDNVPPAFLQQVRALVLNHLHNQLGAEEATEPWVRNALADERCLPDATRTVVGLRFGKNRVTYDPTDPEANKIAVSQGYTVIPGGALSAGEWENVRKAGAALPAGKVTPSPKPYGPGGAPLTLLSRDEWTVGMSRVATLASQLADRLMNVRNLKVQIARQTDWPVLATYGPGGPLMLNAGTLGTAFFESFPHNREEVVDLLIHEFGHEYCGDHLDRRYYSALTSLGAKLVELALSDPAVFTSDQS